MAMKGARALEVWSKRAAEGYPGVKIANMSSSWRDGKAFCAIIHRYRPDLIHWEQVEKNDVKSNCTLAFTIAEKELDIPSLLDPQDMADCTTPDRLSILTYLSEFYHKFKDEKSPLGCPSMVINFKKSSKKSLAIPTSKTQPSKPAAIPASKNNQVVVTPSTRNFVSNYLQESAKMLCNVGNSVIEAEESAKLEITKKKDAKEEKVFADLLGGVTEMICDVENGLSCLANAEKEMPEQINLTKEKLENPHISAEKEPITQNSVVFDAEKCNEITGHSETVTDKISNTLKTVEDSSKNVYGAIKKQSKSSQENISNLVENNIDKDTNEEVTSKRENETHGGDLKRKDSCDSGVSLSPLGSACNSPPTTRSEKSSNVAKAVELFKSQNGQNEINSKAVTNVWRNKSQSISADQIKGSSLTNKTEGKPIKIIGGAKAKVKDEFKNGATTDKNDDKGTNDNANTIKGGIVFKVNNREVFSNNEIKNKPANTDTAPLYNPKPYRPWGSNVLRMSQSFTNNKNKFISQTTLNSSDPADVSSQAPASLSVFKSTPSLFIPNSSFGPTSLSIYSSTPYVSPLSSSGSASLTTQMSCPSLPINKSSTGPISLSINNSPSYKPPLSFQKSYAGPASLLIHNSPPLPTSLPPGPSSFSNQSFPDPTSIIIPNTSESATIHNLSADLEAVKIIKSFPSTPAISPDLEVKVPESSLTQPSPAISPALEVNVPQSSQTEPSPSINKPSKDNSFISISTSHKDQSYSSINNLSSDQSILSSNKSSPDQSYFSSLSLDQSTPSFPDQSILSNKSSPDESILSNKSSPDESFLSFSNSYQDPPFPLAKNTSLDQPISSLHPPSPSISINYSPDLPPNSMSNLSPEPPSLSTDISSLCINTVEKCTDISSLSINTVEKVEAEQSKCDVAVNRTFTSSRHLFSASSATTIAPASSTTTIAPASGPKSAICDKAGPPAPSCDRPKSLICDGVGPISLGCDRPVTFDNGQPGAVSFKAAMRKFRSMTCINQPSQEQVLVPKSGSLSPSLLSGVSSTSIELPSGVSPTSTQLPSGESSTSIQLSSGVSSTSTQLPSGVSPASTQLPSGVSPTSTQLSSRVSSTSTHLPSEVSPTSTQLQARPASHGESAPSGGKDIPVSGRWKVSSSCKPDKQWRGIDATAKPVINIVTPAAVTKDAAIADIGDIAATRHATITIIQHHRDTQSKVNSKQVGEVMETANNDAGNDITDADKVVDGDDTQVNNGGSIDGTGDEVGNKRWSDNAINKQTDKLKLTKSHSLSHTILNSGKSESLSHTILNSAKSESLSQTILNSEYEAGNQPFTITI